jgi:hypothetical protein
MQLAVGREPRWKGRLEGPGSKTNLPRAVRRGCANGSLCGRFKDTAGMPRFSIAEVDFIADDRGRRFPIAAVRNHVDEEFSLLSSAIDEPSVRIVYGPAFGALIGNKDRTWESCYQT